MRYAIHYDKYYRWSLIRCSSWPRARGGQHYRPKHAWWIPWIPTIVLYLSFQWTYPASALRSSEASSYRAPRVGPLPEGFRCPMTPGKSHCVVTISKPDDTRQVTLRGYHKQAWRHQAGHAVSTIMVMELFWWYTDAIVHKGRYSTGAWMRNGDCWKFIWDYILQICLGTINTNWNDRQFTDRNVGCFDLLHLLLNSTCTWQQPVLNINIPSCAE